MGQVHFDKNAKVNLTKTFHLTLKFLGEVMPSDVEEIICYLRNIKVGRFDVFLDEIGVYPNKNHVRLVCVGIKPVEDILLLQKQVDDSLKDVYRKEKEFTPHITLASVKYLKDKERFLEKLKEIKVEPKKIWIKDFRLIKSTLGLKGSDYEDLAVFDSHHTIH